MTTGPAGFKQKISAQHPQMLQQDFQPDQAQNDASCQGGLIFVSAAEPPSDAYAGQRERERGAADESGGRENPYF